MAKTRARLIASASSVQLAKRTGASYGDAVKPGDVRRISPWKIRVLSATHDRLFGKVPFDRAAFGGAGGAAARRGRLDLRRTACVLDRGERPADLYRLPEEHQAQFQPNERVDLAILGMALPDSRARLAGSARGICSRDTFYRVIRTISSGQLSAGFQFGSLTDFPFVQRECAQQNREHLILLDYFRPWTLPAGSKSQIPNIPKGIDHGLRGFNG